MIRRPELRLPLASEKEDFINCIRSRNKPIVDAEIGRRTQSICQIGHIAIDLGRKLRWNHKAEQFIDDDAANLRLATASRAPWGVPGA